MCFGFCFQSGEKISAICRAPIERTKTVYDLRMSTSEQHEKTFTPRLPKAKSSDRDSVIAFGMPKSGSVLLQKLLDGLSKEVGLTPYSLEADAWRKGHSLTDVDIQSEEIFLPRGYMYGVFRQCPISFDIPILQSNKVIALVRDPRDMLVSHYFSIINSHPSPGDGGGLKKNFEASRKQASEKTIDQHCIDTSRWYLNVMKNLLPVFNSSNTKVFKYEEVIFQKRKWVRDIAHHFNWEDINGMALDKIADENDVKPIKEDRSKHIRSVIPGDHREKLEPKTIQSLDQIFEQFMSRFEYF